MLMIGTAAALAGCGGGGGSGNADPSSTAPPSTFSVGGTVSGLAANASLSLIANGTTPVTLGVNGGFTFPQVFQSNAAYAVSVGTQPSGQTCLVSNGSGTVTAPVSNILVNCVTTLAPDTTLTIGGSISGMQTGGQIDLLNNGAGMINMKTNASFSFVATSGASYSISVANHPAGQLCSVSNASGIATANLSNVSITCRAAALSIIAGSGGGVGRSDGIGTNARFNRPQGTAVDSAGNVYVADWYNQLIRKITADGVVTTFAGSYGATGSADGTGAAAQFCRPLAIAIDSADFLYVTDTCNETIRKISPVGVVSTLAGKAGQSGVADGIGANARFDKLAGIAIDAKGMLYVADYGSNTIRKVSPDGAVSTLAGTAGVRGFADGNGSAASFSGPNGIAVDAQGIVYVADGYNQLIRRITTTGVVSTLAGTSRTRGNMDGVGTAAAFSLSTPQTDDSGQPPLSGMVIDSTGTLFLTDRFNDTIRTVSPSGLVTTVVGGNMGYFNGQGTAARFRTPSGISVDAKGNFYVAEDENSTIRKVARNMVTSAFAGKPLISGAKDGDKNVASFYTPYSVAVDVTGNLYVADYGNSIVRKISTDGITTTLAGTAGEIGTTDGVGAAARFYHPSGIAVDAAGMVYVSDAQANTIRKITPAGVVSTLAGDSAFGGTYADGAGKEARFFVPGGLAVDAAANVYVADQFNSAIRKISPSGVVTTIGDRSTAKGVSSVAVDAGGNVYFSSSSENNIKKISADGTVTVLAGSTSSNSPEGGAVDGLGTAARFFGPTGIALDKQGNIYVADNRNNTIRMVTPIGAVSTIAGVAGQYEVHEGPLPALLTPLGLAVSQDGRQIFITGSNAILRITGF